MLRVEVHQDVTVQFAFRQSIGTKHACLLISSDQSLHRTMLQTLVLHDSHDGCYTQTIVGSEGGALGLYPLTIYPWLDGIGLEIMGTLRCLLRNHIHMSLKDDTLLLLHTRRGWLAHHNVVSRILEHLNTGLFAEIKQELLYFL